MPACRKLDGGSILVLINEATERCQDAERLRRNLSVAKAAQLLKAKRPPLRQYCTDKAPCKHRAMLKLWYCLQRSINIDVLDLVHPVGCFSNIVQEH